jgi:hypothetical protein
MHPRYLAPPNDLRRDQHLCAVTDRKHRLFERFELTNEAVHFAIRSDSVG